MSSAYRIAAAGRPAVFQRWQSTGRKGKDKDATELVIPEIEDLSAFAEETRQYWMSLQPAFRRETVTPHSFFLFFSFSFPFIGLHVTRDSLP